MVEFAKKVLKKIKLFVLYWTKIVFVKNRFKVSIFNKIKSNVRGGFLADQYVLYDLKHNSKDEYLSEFDWYRSRYINEPFESALNNKVICNDILKQYIKVADTYFIKNKGNILDFESGIKTADDIIERLKQNENLIIKPFALGKGIGVNLLSYKDGKMMIDGKEVASNEIVELLNSRDGYIVCEYMKQHQYANELYDKTTNTIRIIALRDVETQQFKIYFAVQRIGVFKSIPVDNGSKGGLVAEVNLETGELRAARCLHDLNTYEVHPDSKGRIEGAVIPNWKGIMEEVLAASNRMPYMNFIAWDVLITDKGETCVIEANTSSGVNILQLWEGQRNKELGDFYRYHNVIK